MSMVQSMHSRHEGRTYEEPSHPLGAKVSLTRARRSQLVVTPPRQFRPPLAEKR